MRQEQETPSRPAQQFPLRRRGVWPLSHPRRSVWVPGLVVPVRRRAEPARTRVVALARPPDPDHPTPRPEPQQTPPEPGVRVQRAGDGAVVDATPRALPDGPTAPGHAASDDVPDAPHGGSGHPPSRVRRRSPFPLLAYGRHTFTASPSRASRWQAAGRSPADIGTSDRMVAGHGRMVARRHLTREPSGAHPWRCGPYRPGATGGLAAGATLLDVGTARAP